MSSPALARLLWRPLTLWNAVVVAGLAVVSGLVTLVLRDGRVEASTATVADLQRAAWMRLSLDVVLVAMGLGLVVGWAAYEWLLSPLAARLPRVRRRMGRELLVAALLVAVVTALVADAHPGAQFPPPFLAAGLLWFAVGVVWSDPLYQTSPGLVRWGGLVLTFALIGSAPESTAWLVAHPGLGGIGALVAGLALLALPFHPAAMRLRATHPDCQSSSAYGRGGTEGALARARTRMTWDPADTLAGEADWTRAALFEGLGHSARTWIRALVGAALVWTVIVVLCEFIGGAFGTRESGALVGRVIGNVTGGSGDGLPASMWMVPMFTAMFLSQSRLVPEGAGAPPLSRGSRARVAFRTSLRLTLGLTLVFALVFGGIAVVLILAFLEGQVARSSEGASGGLALPGLPLFLKPLLAALVLAPLPQAVGLRLGAGRRRDQTTHLRTLFVCALAGVPATVVAVLWVKGDPDVPGVVQLAVVALLFALGQVLWRRELERHFRTRDLVLR